MFCVQSIKIQDVHNIDWKNIFLLFKGLCCTFAYQHRNVIITGQYWIQPHPLLSDPEGNPFVRRLVLWGFWFRSRRPFWWPPWVWSRLMPALLRLLLRCLSRSLGEKIKMVKMVDGGMLWEGTYKNVTPRDENAIVGICFMISTAIYSHHSTPTLRSCVHLWAHLIFLLIPRLPYSDSSG